MALLLLCQFKTSYMKSQLHPAQSINAFKSQVEHITRQSPNTPLYFVLTSLDILPGFNAFFRQDGS